MTGRSYCCVVGSVLMQIGFQCSPHAMQISISVCFHLLEVVKTLFKAIKDVNSLS